jgi:hypothetical protein
MNTKDTKRTIEQPKTANQENIYDSHSLGESVKVLGIFVAFVPVLFVFTSISLGYLNPTYDWLRNTISELIWGQNGWVLTVAFCVFGLALITLALRLRVNFANNLKSKLGLILLVMLGLGFLIIAIFPTKAPGAPQSISGLIHLNMVRIMAVLFPASCLLFGTGIRRENETEIIRIQSLAAGVMGILLAVPGAIATLTNAPWTGAIERIILMNGLLWIEGITISVTFPEIIRRLNRLMGSRFTTRTNSEEILTGLAANIK